MVLLGQPEAVEQGVLVDGVQPLAALAAEVARKDAGALGEKQE